MPVLVLLQIAFALAHASTGGQGGNFMVALDDVDGVLGERSPVLWALVPGSVSLSFVLLDDGLNGDRLAGDGLFTGMVNELPQVPVHLSLQTAAGDIWRQQDFLFSGDLQYPALRLRFKDGVVSGELRAEVPPENLKEIENISPGRFWIGAIVSFLVGFLGLNGAKVAVSKIRSRRVARQVQAERGDKWPLSQGLPVLRDGLQIWERTGASLELRKRILSHTEVCRTVFWLPVDGVEGLGADQVSVWVGEPPSIGEIMHWRDLAFDRARVGPVFIEGLVSVRSGDLTEAEWLTDLSEMAKGPVVLIISEGELPPIVGLAQHRV
jgi:hypothetical protein